MLTQLRVGRSAHYSKNITMWLSDYVLLAQAREFADTHMTNTCVSLINNTDYF